MRKAHSHKSSDRAPLQNPQNEWIKYAGSKVSWSGSSQFAIPNSWSFVKKVAEYKPFPGGCCWTNNNKFALDAGNIPSLKFQEACIRKVIIIGTVTSRGHSE